QTSPSALTFAVQDSGIGIPKNDMPRLFEKFYRGTNREALAERGTGLGLAIVKSIAERHGGKVWVESELGKGSIFYLKIPLTQLKESSRV
ncbi:MAG: sensor histidine kinase, partial [Anaerolineales bacterium]